MTTYLDAGVSRLLSGLSLEITAKDTGAWDRIGDRIAPGTPVNVTFLGNETNAMRLEAARTVQRVGCTPVPHIAARRLTSQDELAGILDGLQAAGIVDVFVVAGDPPAAAGPFHDALAVLESGLLEQKGVTRVGISGYPDGHPGIAADVLWRSLSEKVAVLRDRGLQGEITTQFTFDAAPVVGWIEQLRGRGVDLPVRIGVPGPAGVKRLLSYASRFGVGTSASIAKKYGFSMTNLLGKAGPDRFITDLARRYDPGSHGDVRLHFYTFGGLEATADWIAAFRGEARS